MKLQDLMAVDYCSIILDVLRSFYVDVGATEYLYCVGAEPEGPTPATSELSLRPMSPLILPLRSLLGA